MDNDDILRVAAALFAGLAPIRAADQGGQLTKDDAHHVLTECVDLVKMQRHRMSEQRKEDRSGRFAYGSKVVIDCD